MIEIIPTLLTPAMLAISPPNTPAPEHVYDWKTQQSSITIGGKKLDPVKAGSMRGSNCFVSGAYTIDDWNQD